MCINEESVCEHLRPRRSTLTRTSCFASFTLRKSRRDMRRGLKACAGLFQRRLEWMQWGKRKLTSSPFFPGGPAGPREPIGPCRQQQQKNNVHEPLVYFVKCEELYFLGKTDTKIQKQVKDTHRRARLTRLTRGASESLRALCKIHTRTVIYQNGRYWTDNMPQEVYWQHSGL